MFKYIEISKYVKILVVVVLCDNALPSGRSGKVFRYPWAVILVELLAIPPSKPAFSPFKTGESPVFCSYTKFKVYPFLIKDALRRYKSFLRIISNRYIKFKVYPFLIKDALRRYKSFLRIISNGYIKLLIDVTTNHKLISNTLEVHYFYHGDLLY